MDAGVRTAGAKEVARSELNLLVAAQGSAPLGSAAVAFAAAADDLDDASFLVTARQPLPPALANLAAKAAAAGLLRDPAGRDPAGSDPAGIDPVGSDPVGDPSGGSLPVGATAETAGRRWLAQSALAQARSSLSSSPPF